MNTKEDNQKELIEEAKKPVKKLVKLISVLTSNSIKTDEKLKEISMLCLKKDEIV